VFKCKACHRQFSATSGTLLAYRKLPFRTLLIALSLFVNAAKGLSSLQLSRDLGLHAKTTFVLLHKLRCALTSNSAATIVSGVVEIDGGWFGGHIRPENYRVARIDRRRREHQNGTNIITSRGLISASMPVKWHGAKTCAARRQEPNSMHVAS
jgi:hypothetical protein